MTFSVPSPSQRPLLTFMDLSESSAAKAGRHSEAVKMILFMKSARTKELGPIYHHRPSAKVAESTQAYNREQNLRR